VAWIEVFRDSLTKQDRLISQKVNFQPTLGIQAGQSKSDGKLVVGFDWLCAAGRELDSYYWPDLEVPDRAKVSRAGVESSANLSTDRRREGQYVT
jgi:hypothetical protein